MMTFAPESPIRTLFLEPSLAEVSRGRHFVEELAVEAGFSPERVFDIVVASSEAIANAIEHARCEDQVEVRVLSFPDRLEVQIEDPGRFQPPTSTADRANRGLGLPLMAALSDHFALYSGPRGGTLVSLAFYRAGASSTYAGLLPPSLRELAAETSLLRGVVDHLPDAFYILDDEWRLLYANDRFVERNGLRREDVIGRPLWDVFPSYRAERGTLLEAAKVAGTAVYSVSPGGSPGSWREWCAFPVPEGMAVISRDVSERKRAEEALSKVQAALEESYRQLERRVTERTAELARAKEELEVEVTERRRAEANARAERKRLDDVLDMLPAYVVLLSQDHRVLFANRFFKERFGETEGGRCYEYLFQRSEPCEKCETYTVFRTNAPHSWHWTGPDGRDYDIYDFPFVDSDGSSLIMEVGLDITEREQAQVALKDERQRLFDVLETVPAMVCLLGEDHHVAFANRSFREKFGESEGRHCYECCFGMSEPCDFCESYEVLQTHRPHHWVCESPDGGVIDVYDFPFTDTDGSTMILKMDIDITEQRETQNELRAHRDHLRRLVEERTAGLAAANADLEAANRELVAREERLRVQNEELRASMYNRSLIEAALDPLVTISPLGKITDVNEATVKITGRSRENLIGTDFCEYFTDPVRAQQGYREVFDKGSVTDYPLTIRGQDGRLTDVLYNASVYRDQEGNILGVFAAARDITALKELEAERSFASQLQEALLHIPTRLGPMRLGHLYRSATEAARIGGDFYDVFHVKDGKIAVLIGDVAGHGIEGARVATLTKDVIHAYAHQTQCPEQILRRTNSLLVEKSLRGFVTVFLGILDSRTGSFRFASAAHPSLLRRASREIEFLGGGAPPLGVFPEVRLRLGEIELASGDLILLYTDGVTEARRDGELFGEDRLRALLGRTRVSVEHLPAHILDRVLAFSGGGLQDDLAILTIQLSRVGSESEGGENVHIQERLGG